MPKNIVEELREQHGLGKIAMDDAKKVQEITANIITDNRTFFEEAGRVLIDETLLKEAMESSRIIDDKLVPDCEVTTMLITHEGLRRTGELKKFDRHYGLSEGRDIHF